MDSDGEIDYDAIRKIKKEASKKFTDMKDLDHQEISYKKFEKNFYFEDPEIKNMRKEEVKALR